MSSEELASYAEAGSSASFEMLFQRYADPLRGFLMQRVRNRHDAEDLLQDTFVRAYEKLHLFDNRYSFKTWLFTIAARLAYSYQRKHVDTPVEYVETVDAHDPAGLMVVKELSGNVWDIVRSQLPALQATALWLRYGEGLNIKETARRMDKSQAYVKVLLHRGRVALVAEMKGRMYDL
jgi:RNA polymerase sigma-70 factor (ECF subfamily)